MVDFELTPQQNALVIKTRDFARKEIIPIAAFYDDTGELPFDVLQKAFDLGLMNMGIPRQLGGAELSVFEQCLVVEELAAACAGLTTSLYGNELGIEAILLGGTKKQKKNYLIPLTKLLGFLSLCVSEPGMGSDVAGIQSIARRDGDEYILDGVKYWITNGNFATNYIVFARMEGTRRHSGITAFVIQRDNPGIMTGMNIEKLGHRASNTAVVILREARVPSEHMLGLEGEGFQLAMRTFAKTRPVIGAMATGLARSAMEYAIEYAKKRKAFETKIAEFQSVQSMIADMYLKIEAMRTIVWKAAWMTDHGMDSKVMASCAKAFSSDAAMAIAEDALQIFGGFGYAKNTPIEKIFRDAKLFQIYEGTSQIQKLVISRYALRKYEGTLVDLTASTAKQESEKEEELWICPVCGYEHHSSEIPEICPVCGIRSESFVRIN